MSPPTPSGPARGAPGWNVDSLRADTPGCLGRVHLNNAGSALMPDPVLRAIQDHLVLESRIGGYEAEDARQEAIREAYRAIAELIGTRPRNVAFTESATASYVQALSSIPFAPGDTLVTSLNDYVSNQIQFLALQKRFGVRVIRAPDATEGGVDAGAVEEALRRHAPKVVCITHVPTSSGLVQDVAAVGRICREREVLYLVDACQSVGQLPVDVETIGCDFLSVTSRKFLRGPRGAGFLYVSDGVLDRGLEPLFIDMRGAEWTAPDAYRPVADARRFESWEFAWSLVLGTGAAARYASALGLPAIAERVQSLATRLREGLAALPGVRVLDRGPVLSGIVTCWIEGKEPDELCAELRRRRIHTTAQVKSDALLDYGGKNVGGSLRLSPHYYNTEDELDRAVSAIAELAG